MTEPWIDSISQGIIDRYGPGKFGYESEIRRGLFTFTLTAPGVRISGDPKATFDEAIESAFAVADSLVKKGSVQ